MPFSGVMLGEYGEYRLSVIVYSLHLTAASLTLSWLWRYACRNRKLVEPDLDRRVIRYNIARSLFLPLIFLIAAGVALISAHLAQFALLLSLFVRPLASRYARLRG